MSIERSCRRIRRGLRALSIVIAAASCLTLSAGLAQAQAQKGVPKGKPVPGVQEFSGKLADGTPYLIRKPRNWNGIVVRDLDGITRKDDAAYSLMLRAGYGTVGVTRRSPDREWTLNRWDDMQRPQQALEIFRAKFGEPKLVIAFGRSAGGASALLTAERHPETVDGAVALCATMDFIGYTGYNIIFDAFYILKALLAPNDDQLLTHELPTGNTEPYMRRWSEVLQNAAKTPEGRARIALAFNLTQYPILGSHTVEKGVTRPDINDPDAVMNAIVQSLPNLVRRLGLLSVHGEEDFPPDLPIPGTPVSNPVGNDGAVYADYWKNVDPALKRVTEALYAKTKLNLAADLKTLDASPRVSLDRDSMRREVLGRGLITMPVFRMDNLGDQTGSPNAAKLYDRLVAFNGLTDLYRTSYVDNSGHCFFKPEQEFTAVEVMRERLQTGKWPDTSAAALNARARVNDGDGIIFANLESSGFIGGWRLEAYTDLFQPATFASTSDLVSNLKRALTPAQRQQLLSHLSEAEQAARTRQATQANAALDQFVRVVNGVDDRIVRTRLLAAAHQLRVR
jgi:pimeloyl-ACP methyl ester carboxylesterase